MPDRSVTVVQTVAVVGEHLDPVAGPHPPLRARLDHAPDLALKRLETDDLGHDVHRMGAGQGVGLAAGVRRVAGQHQELADEAPDRRRHHHRSRRCPLRLFGRIRTRYHPAMTRLRRILPVLLLLSLVLGAVQAVSGRVWADDSAGAGAWSWTACLPDGCDTGGDASDTGAPLAATCAHGGGCAFLPASPAVMASVAGVKESHRPGSPVVRAGRSPAPDHRPPISGATA